MVWDGGADVDAVAVDGFILLLSIKRYSDTELAIIFHETYPATNGVRRRIIHGDGWFWFQKASRENPKRILATV